MRFTGGVAAPGVGVSYTTEPGIPSAPKFRALGLPAAGGVPLQGDEGAQFKSFRVGLVGLDKLGNVEPTVASLEDVVNRLN